MNILLPCVVLIILAVVYAGSLHNSKSRLYVVITILFFILLLCWIQLNTSINNSNNSNNSNNRNNRNNSNNRIEHFYQSGYAPLDYKLQLDNNSLYDSVSASGNGGVCDSVKYMNINNKLSPLGTYDGLNLPGNNIHTAPLNDKVFLTTPSGEDLELTEDMSSKNYPSVDGTESGNKHLFVFANNNANINCKSQYSTSTGQVCLSPEQINMFSGRRN